MSRIRVQMLAAIVGVVMVIPAPLTVWAVEQGHKIAKQDEKGEQKEGEKKQEKKKEGKKKQENEKQKADKEAESTPEEQGRQEEKVTICHRPGGKPENAKTITVAASAVEKHLAHGDSRGPCQ